MSKLIFANGTCEQFPDELQYFFSRAVPPDFLLFFSFFLFFLICHVRNATHPNNVHLSLYLFLYLYLTLSCSLSLSLSSHRIRQPTNVRCRRQTHTHQIFFGTSICNFLDCHLAYKNGFISSNLCTMLCPSYSLDL